MASVEFLGISAKDGKERWRLIAEGPRIDGERNQIKKCFKGTQKQAEKEAIRLEIEVKKPQYIKPTKETFAIHAQRWLVVHGDKLQPKTLQRYEELLERILPHLGHIPIERIRMENIEDLYSALAKEPKRSGKGTLSKTTILHHHRLLHTILEYAVKRGLIPANPTQYVRPDSPAKKELNFYSSEQVAKLIELLEEEPLKHKALVHLAISTGARAGEIQALKWDDIDFDKKTVKISKSAQYISGMGAFNKEPKNESSKRVVSVSASVIFILKQLKGQQEAKAKKLKNKWIETDSVFTTWNGKQIHPTYASHWWPEFISKTELPPITFHGLRHTCASLLLSAGQNVVAVAKRLGHSDTNTTLRIYAHSFVKDDEASADMMDVIINGKKNNETEMLDQA